MRTKLLFLLIFTKIAFAGPWMTGPLLAPSGKTIPRNHFNFEPYGFYTTYPADFRNIEVTPVLSVGLTDFMDVQTSLPYDYSWDRGEHGNGIGDYSLGLGFQILNQKDQFWWWPDLRAVVQEVFPTGRFENLSLRKLDTDQTGSGSYQTFVGLNFQKMFHIRNDHYLRTRFTLTGAFPSDVDVHGRNVFGGAGDTEGHVRPGNSLSIDLAFEYSLTQKWVAVFETLYVNSMGTNFSGSPGFTPGGTMAAVGGEGGNSVSLAPAIEYNFSANLGIIGGVWFSITGPHASKFTSGVLAINYYM